MVIKLRLKALIKVSTKPKVWRTKIAQLLYTKCNLHLYSM